MNCPTCGGVLSSQALYDIYVCYVCKVGWGGITLRNATTSKGLAEIKGAPLIKILVSGGIPQRVAEDLLKGKKERKMATVLVTLTNEFREKLEEVVRDCEKEGFTLHPYCGLRNCREQAIIFRKTRTKAEIATKVQSLIDRGAIELANIIIDVGPQKGTLGAHITKAGPGESWHQYAVAADCVPLLGGKALWGAEEEEWKIFGNFAVKRGLTWAGNWTTFREFPHIQLPQGGNPLSSFTSPDDALAAMRKVGAL